MTKGRPKNNFWKNKTKQKRKCNTRTSQEVTHPSTTLAQARLTAEFWWDPINLAKSAFLLWQGHANFIARWTYWNFTTTRTYAKFTMLSGGMDHKTYYDLDRGSEEIYYAAERDALWNLLWYGKQPKVYYNLDLFQKKNYKFQSSLPSGVGHSVSPIPRLVH